MEGIEEEQLNASQFTDEEKEAVLSSASFLLYKEGNQRDFRGKFLEALAKEMNIPFNPSVHDDPTRDGVHVATLCSFEEEKKTGLLLFLLHFSIRHLEKYDARIRVLLRQYTALLNQSMWWFVQEESQYASMLRQILEQGSHALDEHKEARTRSSSMSRWLKIGSATVVGGALLVFTGGLAAPAVAAGIGALGLTSAAVFIGSTVGYALVVSIFGAAGAGLGGYKMNRRVAELEEFEFDRLSEFESLSVVIAISGWVTQESEWESVWDSLPGYCPTSDIYNLKYETKIMIELGNSISSFITNQAVSRAKAELNTLLSAVAWPTFLITSAGIIDNSWSVALSRADKAGLLLADAIMSEAHGKRPVILIGFSLGARVIAKALLELERQNCYGLIEQAVLIGIPFTSDKDTWKKMTSVVAGRVVNGYSRGDWVLSFLYRTMNFAYEIAGLSEVNVQGVENIDLTDLIHGHHEYKDKLKEVMDFIKFRQMV